MLTERGAAMRWRGIVIVIYGLGLALLLLAGIVTRAPAPVPQPAAGPMSLPPDYRTQFVHYATVDRSDAVSRNLYIDPASLAALRAGQPLPEGTRIIIEAFDGEPGPAGRLRQTQVQPFVHMAEKRSTWRIEDLQTAVRVGDWNFASFDQTTGQPAPADAPGENLNDCFVCHDVSATARRDFVFTQRLLAAYARTGTLQYERCGLPERLPCRR